MQDWKDVELLVIMAFPSSFSRVWRPQCVPFCIRSLIIFCGLLAGPLKSA